MTRFKQLKETLNVLNIDQAIDTIQEQGKGNNKGRICMSYCKLQSNTRDCGNQCRLGIRAYLEESVNP